MNSGADIGVNTASSQIMIDTSLKPSSLRAKSLDLVCKSVVKRFGNRGVMPSEKSLGTAAHIFDGRGWIIDPLQKLGNMAPVLRGLGGAPIPLVQFRQPKLCHHMPPVNRQRAFQAAHFAYVILHRPTGCGQIHP